MQSEGRQQSVRRSTLALNHWMVSNHWLPFALACVLGQCIVEHTKCERFVCASKEQTKRVTRKRSPRVAFCCHGRHGRKCSPVCVCSPYLNNSLDLRSGQMRVCFRDDQTFKLFSNFQIFQQIFLRLWISLFERSLSLSDRDAFRFIRKVFAGGQVSGHDEQFDQQPAKLDVQDQLRRRDGRFRAGRSTSHHQMHNKPSFDSSNTANGKRVFGQLLQNVSRESFPNIFRIFFLELLFRSNCWA